MQTATATTERTEMRLVRHGGQDIVMAFRRIPSGEFLMGSRGYNIAEEPVHLVEVDHDFWLGETPVTQAQFAVWTESTGVEHANEFGGRPHHPAESMNWHQAMGYCRWLTENFQDQLPKEHQIATLPSEAQWEYACRAGTDTEYHTGDGEAALRQAGWFGED